MILRYPCREASRASEWELRGSEWSAAQIRPCSTAVLAVSFLRKERLPAQLLSHSSANKAAHNDDSISNAYWILILIIFCSCLTFNEVGGSAVSILSL